MTELNLTEPQAHHFIIHAAMYKRWTKFEIAAAILREEKLYV